MGPASEAPAGFLLDECRPEIRSGSKDSGGHPRYASAQYEEIEFLSGFHRRVTLAQRNKFNEAYW